MNKEQKKHKRLFHLKNGLLMSTLFLLSLQVFASHPLPLCYQKLNLLVDQTFKKTPYVKRKEEAIQRFKELFYQRYLDNYGKAMKLNQDLEFPATVEQRVAFAMIHIKPLIEEYPEAFASHDVIKKGLILLMNQAHYHLLTKRKMKRMNKKTVNLMLPHAPSVWGVFFPGKKRAQKAMIRSFVQETLDHGMNHVVLESSLNRALTPHRVTKVRFFITDALRLYFLIMFPQFPKKKFFNSESLRSLYHLPPNEWNETLFKDSPRVLRDESLKKLAAVSVTIGFLSYALYSHTSQKQKMQEMARAQGEAFFAGLKAQVNEPDSDLEHAQQMIAHTNELGGALCEDFHDFLFMAWKEEDIFIYSGSETYQFFKEDILRGQECSKVEAIWLELSKQRPYVDLSQIFFDFIY